ncbi:type I toxin-antitoxin system ptaRNA1 family toxin [Aeromonas simiae]|nr:type I toxin-antitoxin system ptaRNA1 family toxin [Aeromonas simiae]
MKQTISTNERKGRVPIMASTDNRQVQHAIHHAAATLALQKFIDQKTAQQIAPVAEAIANLCTLLYYQADTGAVAEDEFQYALARIRQAVAT